MTVERQGIITHLYPEFFLLRNGLRTLPNVSRTGDQSSRY